MGHFVAARKHGSGLPRILPDSKNFLTAPSTRRMRKHFSSSNLLRFISRFLILSLWFLAGSSQMAVAHCKSVGLENMLGSDLPLYKVSQRNFTMLTVRSELKGSA
ncbi:unnamed protein product [Enterobius vermicularis]|uniref:Secreted protein n=1 Tax=Enterobius vermicularis TaxID=51028 RepID=A0A0N4VEI5_ENTVE|nr:unnamed protein product [Enterobius vermicularis]